MSEVQAEAPKAEAPVAPAPVEPVAPVEEPKQEPKYTQAEMDAITKKVRQNATHRAKREVEAYYRGRQEAQPQPRVEPVQPAAPKDDTPKREQFEDYESFIKAEARHEAKKAAKETLENERMSIHEQSVHASQQQQLKAWSEQVDKARQDIPDFDDIVATSEAPVTVAMSAAIMESERGAWIAAHLAKNPEEAERISKLTPARQAAAIVALEEKVAKPAKAPSKVPPPINPVGKASEASDLTDTRDPKAAEKLSTSEWIRLDRERRAKAGIR